MAARQVQRKIVSADFVAYLVIFGFGPDLPACDSFVESFAINPFAHSGSSVGSFARRFVAVSGEAFASRFFGFGSSSAYFFSIIFVWPPVIIVLLARHKLHAVLSAFMITIFWWIVAFSQLINIHSRSDDAGIIFDEFGVRFRDPNTEYVAVLLWWGLPLVALLAAPAKAISRHLIFLTIGLILLIAFNELSKLSLVV